MLVTAVRVEVDAFAVFRHNLGKFDLNILASRATGNGKRLALRQGLASVFWRANAGESGLTKGAFCQTHGSKISTTT
jgi:hypothetical protein